MGMEARGIFYAITQNGWAWKILQDDQGVYHLLVQQERRREFKHQGMTSKDLKTLVDIVASMALESD
jgi:hypothetical protein